jgi:hypothetical protein
MPNQTLADAATAAVTDNHLTNDMPKDPGVKAPGMCSAFVRRVVRKVYGSKFDHLFGKSARVSGKNFQSTSFARPYGGPASLQVGDLLFKLDGSKGFGHVGIFVGPQGVAENSSTKVGRVSGAKGYRSVQDFGKPDKIDLIVRLPDPHGAVPATSPAPTVSASPATTLSWYLNGLRMGSIPVQAGTGFCPVREWAEAIGFEVDWDEQIDTALLDGSPIKDDQGNILTASKTPKANTIWLFGGVAYAPIRLLAKNAGLLADFDKENSRIIISRPIG